MLQIWEMMENNVISDILTIEGGDCFSKIINSILNSLRQNSTFAGHYAIVKPLLRVLIK